MVLYLLVAVMVAIALMQYPVQPAELTPPYWVFMGATAISVLAGALILRLPPASLGAAVHGVVAGLPVVLWAFGTWLIPLPLVLGARRHLLRHVSLAYEPGMWSIVFPAGMCGVASRELGAALNVSWLVTLGRYEAWLALAAWAVVAVAMTVALLGLPVRLPARRSPGGQSPAEGTSRAPALAAGAGSRRRQREAASTGNVPNPASMAAHAAVRPQPPPVSVIRASTPALPRIARVRQPRSRIPVSRRFPAGPPPAVTGSRNVSARASIWPTTPAPRTGISSRPSTWLAVPRPAASPAVSAASAATSQAVPASNAQAASVCGGLARISRARWQQRRRGARQISGQPGGEQVRAGQQRARDERGHCHREPAGGEREDVAGDTRGVVADPGAQHHGPQHELGADDREPQPVEQIDLRARAPGRHPVPASVPPAASAAPTAT